MSFISVAVSSLKRISLSLLACLGLMPALLPVSKKSLSPPCLKLSFNHNLPTQNLRRRSVNYNVTIYNCMYEMSPV